jgi:hypothetical protein
MYRPIIRVNEGGNRVLAEKGIVQFVRIQNSEVNNV